jgi:hypothetical protein
MVSSSEVTANRPAQTAVNYLMKVVPLAALNSASPPPPNIESAEPLLVWNTSIEMIRMIANATCTLMIIVYIV